METITTFGASGYAINDLELFQDVDNISLQLADCPIVRIASGESVSHDNDGGSLYIVLRGALNVQQIATQGSIVDNAATRILPGECVGELAVLDEESSPAAMTAVQESDLLVVNAAKLWKLVEESNGVARNLLRLLSFRIRAANAQLRKRQKVGEFYRQLSIVDSLTGLHNRAWLDENLSAMVEDAHASNKPLSIVMVDIDHFKNFNDTHGHQAGDEALRTAAKVLSGALRPTDFAARYGGEELIVILPNSNRIAGSMVAQRLCERLRQAVVFSDMRQPLPHITASFGVAGLCPEQDSVKLIALADAALYKAKEAGRNCVSESA